MIVFIAIIVIIVCSVITAFLLESVAYNRHNDIKHGESFYTSSWKVIKEQIENRSWTLVETGLYYDGHKSSLSDTVIKMDGTKVVLTFWDWWRYN